MADLTTLAQVKERFDSSSLGSDYDDVLESLIDEVSQDMQTRMGRILAEDTYTHYLDAPRSSRLFLRQGPLVSVTSVQSVEYGKDSNGDRTETLTTVDTGDFLEGGLRADGHILQGWLDQLYGTWGWANSQRTKALKVVYVAGFSTLPEDIVGAATERVVEKFNTRTASGLENTGTGDDTGIDIVPVTVSIRNYEYVVQKYRLWGVA